MSVYACSCVRVRGWERIAWRCGCSRRHGPDGSRSASPAKVLSRQEARGDADVRTELGDPPEHVSYVCAVPHAMAGRVAQLVAYACMMWLSEWCGMELLAVLQVWRTCVQNQILHNILLLSMYVHGGVGGATGPLLTCQNATPAYLIVAARKKVRVHKWNGSAMKFEHYKDHVTTDEALSLVWTGDNTVIVGFKNEYTVLNIETGDTRRVFETRHTLAAANFVPRCVVWAAVLHGYSMPRSRVGLHRRRTTLIGELHSNQRSRSASRASGSHRMLTTSGASGGSAVDDEEIPSVEALLVKGSKNGAQGAVQGGCGLGAHGGVLTPARWHVGGRHLCWTQRSSHTHDRVLHPVAIHSIDARVLTRLPVRSHVPLPRACQGPRPHVCTHGVACSYVVSAHPRAIEVHNILTMSLAQSVPLPGAISVTAFLPHTTRFDGGGSGAGAGAGAGSGAEPSTSRTPEHVLVVCPNDVFVLRMVPLVMQVAALVSRRPAEFEEALALCEHCHSEGVRPSQAHLATSHVPQLAHTLRGCAPRFARRRSARSEATSATSCLHRGNSMARCRNCGGRQNR